MPHKGIFLALLALVLAFSSIKSFSDSDTKFF